MNHEYYVVLYGSTVVVDCPFVRRTCDTVAILHCKRIAILQRDELHTPYAMISHQTFPAMSSTKDDVVELLGPSEPRQWTWVFRALWSSAPRDDSKVGQWQQGDRGGVSATAANISSSSRIASPPCQLQLQIPDTILFERGEPRKWVGTSRKGIVVRKSFLPPTSSENGNGFSNHRAAASSEIRRRPLATRRFVSQQQSSSSKATLDDVEVLQRLDTIRMAFVAFVAQGSLPIEPTTPVCVARYNDGSTELLSNESLQKLGGFYNWRVSLSGLQAYVRPAQTTTGAYDRSSRISNRENDRKRKPKDHVTALCQPHESAPTSEGSRRRTSSTPTSSSDRAYSNGELTSNFPCEKTPPDTGTTPMDYAPIATRQRLSAFALDVVTTDIAWVVETSYAWPKEPRSHRLGKKVTTALNGDTFVGGSGTHGESSSSRKVLLCGTGGGERPPWPSSRVQISRLEAEFITDDTGCAWFSYATRVMVQTVTKEPKVVGSLERQGAKRKRLREEAAVAASVAARELRALVALACRRGLNAEEVFCHFGVGVCGRAGKEEVVKGMATLGISLSMDGAAMLVKLVIAARSGSTDGQSSTTVPSSVSQGNLEQLLLEKGVRTTTGDISTTIDSKASHVATKIPVQVVRKNNCPGLMSTPLLQRHHFTADDLWKFARTAPEETWSKAEVSSEPNGYENDDNDDGGGENLIRGRGSARKVGPDERGVSDDNEKTTMEKSTKTKRRRTSGDVTSDRRGLGWAESHSNSYNASISTGRGSALLAEKKSSTTRRGRWRQKKKQGSTSASLYRDDHCDSAASKKQEAKQVLSSSNVTPISMPVSIDGESFRCASGLAENETVTTPPRSTTCSDVPDRNVTSAAGRGNDLHRGESGKLHNAGASSRTKGSVQGAKVLRSTDCDNPGVLASFPCDNPLAEAAFGKDRVFHVKRCVQYGFAERIARFV